MEDDSVFSSVNMMTCPICQEAYKKPKYLHCLHTFCEKCLSSYIGNIANVCKKLGSLPVSILDNKPYVWTGDGFPCPVCRSHIPAPKNFVGESIPTKWAEAFPVNQLVLSLMGYEAIPNEEKICSPCQKINDPKPAHYWCVECSEPLCGACSRHHQVLKATGSHSVVTVKEMKDTGQLVKHDPIVQCHLHDGKKIEMYCVDDNKVLCSECVTTDHRRCDNIITIDKVSGEIKNSLEAHKLLAKLEECMTEAETIVVDRKRNIEKLHTKKTDIIDKVRKVKEQVNKVLEDLENMFTEDLNGNLIVEVTNLEDQINRCHLLQKAIRSSGGILQAAISHGTDDELFVVAHRMEKELRRYENVMEKEERQLNEIDFSFEVNYEIEHILLALDEIGSLKIDRIPSEIPPFAKKNAQLMNKFDATCTMDDRCAELTGCTFMSEDRLLLVDNANEKLKLFTQDGDLLSELEMSSAPWDITSVPGSMAVVTLPEEKKIMMVSSSNDCITPIDQFHTNGKCYGIAYSYNDKALVLSCDSATDGSAEVKVMTLNGFELRELELNKQSRTFSSRPGYIATNPFNSDVYISDESNNAVVGMTLTGDFLFTYSEKYLKLPVGVASDYHGCIYVCGNGSCDIHQLSRDGKRLRLLIDGLSHPRAISFEPYGDHFMVTSDGSFKSTVQVYRLQ